MIGAVFGGTAVAVMFYSVLFVHEGTQQNSYAYAVIGLLLCSLAALLWQARR